MVSILVDSVLPLAHMIHILLKMASQQLEHIPTVRLLKTLSGNLDMDTLNIAKLRVPLLAIRMVTVPY